MYSTNLAAITTPIDTIETSQESILSQYPRLSATDIEKVLYLTGMSDAGRFDAIIANSDTAGLLAMFGMTYAELKEILALPDDRLATAPEKSSPLITDKAIAATPENLLPYPPLPKITFFTGVENEPPMSSDTDMPAESPKALSPPLAPPTLDDGHTTDLPPQPVDSSAATDVAMTAPPATSDAANPVTTAPNAPAPENSEVQGTLPDVPCSVDLGEITPVPAAPVNLPPDSGSDLPLSLAEMKNVLATLGISDAGSPETLAAFAHDNNLAGFLDWAVMQFTMKQTERNPVDAGMNGVSSGSDISLAAAPEIIGPIAHLPDESITVTPSPAALIEPSSDAGNVPDDDKEENQDDDEAPLISEELLLPGPPGPGSTPVSEPPPVVVPPVVGPPEVPVVPAPETVPVQPVPETVPVQPVPETVPVQPIPAAQVPEAGSLVPNQGAGSNGSGGTESSVSASESNLFNEIAKLLAAGPKSSSSTSSSSSSSGLGGFGFSGGSSLSGAGGDSGGGVLTTLVAAVAGGLLVHTISGAESDNSGDGSTGRPPMAGPDGYAAWQKAFAERNEAATEINRLQDQLRALADRACTYYTQAIRALDKAFEMEMLIELRETQIAANQEEIARNFTMIARHGETIEDLRAARELAWDTHAAAEVLVHSAESAITAALETMNTSTVQAVKDAQADIVVAQANIVYQQEGVVIDQLERMRNLDDRIAIMGRLIQEVVKANTNLQIANLLIDSKLMQARNYLGDLRSFADAQDALGDGDPIQKPFARLKTLHDWWKTTLTDAENLMTALDAFRGDVTALIPLDEEPDWDDIFNAGPEGGPDDPAMPQLPPGLSDIAGTGATHTTTGTSGAPSDAQDEEGDEENDADGDSHMGIHLNVNLALDPADPQTTPPGNTASLPPADALSTNPNPADQPDVTGTGHNVRSMPPTSDDNLPAPAIAASAGGERDLQVEMVHSSAHPGSSTSVLRFEAVVDKLPILRAIVEAWMRSLPSSADFAFDGFDIVNPQEAGPVTLDIHFSLRAGHASGANLDLPADAVAALKAAMQGVVAIWEHEQESAARVAAFEAAVHYGVSDMTTASSVMLAFEFSTRPGASESAEFIERSHDVHAVASVLTQWMSSIDRDFAATVVAFDIVDLTNHGDMQLQVLVNAMPVIPDPATLLALQNAMQDYLATPASLAPDHPPILDGATHQALGLTGVAGLGELA